MAVLLAVHSLQFLTHILYVYVIEDPLSSTLTCMCCLVLVPFIMYIYIAIAAGVLHGCQDLMKTWLITDCIIFAISTGYYIMWAAKIFNKRT